MLSGYHSSERQKQYKFSLPSFSASQGLEFYKAVHGNTQLCFPLRAQGRGWGWEVGWGAILAPNVMQYFPVGRCHHWSTINQ